MTDNDIIKALECCNSNGDVSCLSCPYEIYQESCINFMGCNHLLMLDAIDLINRQKAEIERLEKQLYGDRVYLKQLLPENFDFEQCTVLEAIVNAKAEAIKEFTKRLKKEAVYPYVECDLRVVTVEDIDNLVKEMVGNT